MEKSKIISDDFYAIRKATGADMHSIKKALELNDYNVDKAIQYLLQGGYNSLYTV